MLHFWLIPTVVVILIVIAVLYLVLSVWGGNGVRTSGRVLLDAPDKGNPEDDQR